MAEGLVFETTPAIEWLERDYDKYTLYEVPLTRRNETHFYCFPTESAEFRGGLMFCIKEDYHDAEYYEWFASDSSFCWQASYEIPLVEGDQTSYPF